MTVTNTPAEQISALVTRQRTFFNSEATLPYKFRLKQLERLLKALRKWHKPLCDALWADLHKSEQEAVLTELSIVEGELEGSRPEQL